jgi:hypothetical protein
MGPQFPDDPIVILDEMQPSMKGDKIVWQHRPSRLKPTWRTREISVPVI